MVVEGRKKTAEGFGFGLSSGFRCGEESKRSLKMRFELPAVVGIAGGVLTWNEEVQLLSRENRKVWKDTQCRKLWARVDFAAMRAVSSKHWECPEECKAE